MPESEFNYVSAVVSLNGALRIWQVDCVQNREAQKSFCLPVELPTFCGYYPSPKFLRGTIDGCNGP